MYPDILPGSRLLDSDEALEASCTIEDCRTTQRLDRTWGTWSASPQTQASSRTLSGGGQFDVKAALRGHQWLCDPRTWIIGLGLLLTCGLPMVSHFFNEEEKHMADWREEVTQIARLEKRALEMQLRSSVGTLKALQVLLEVDEPAVMRDFAKIARLLIDRFGGITSLQLAPFGEVSKVYPIIDNHTAIGRNALLDPGCVYFAMKAIHSREATLSGPRELREMNMKTGVRVRLAIFSKGAPRFLPDSYWRFPNGTTLVPHCKDRGPTKAEHGSQPAKNAKDDEAGPADEVCSLPGPVVDDTQTYFWGFATMVTLISDLLRPLHFLEDSGEGRFDFEILDKGDFHPSLAPRGEIKRNSSVDLNTSSAVSIPIEVEELEVEWEMNLMPQGGWPLLTDGFWKRLVLLLISVMSLLAVCTALVYHNVRGAYKRLDKLEEFRKRKRLAIVESAVEDIDRVRFPMCVMRLDDFEALGKLIAHEDARSRALLSFLDTREALEEHMLHTAFVSHQWTGFSHPDHTGEQYRSMVRACAAARDHLKHDLRWVWVDYFSIPQRNRDQQQVAIDTLAVYAAHSAVFLAAVPSCSHAELDAQVDAGSYMGRAWCRLEQLAFVSAHSHMDRLPAYKCGGGTVLQPLFPDDRDDFAFRRVETGSERLMRFLTGGTTGSSSRLLVRREARQGSGVSDADGHPWQVALEVMSGSFTCCARCHPDGMPCDKSRVVGAMLGILWRLKAAGADGGQGASQVRMLLRVVDENPERFFPKELTRVSTCRSGSGMVVEEVKELFGDLVVIMDQLFKERSRHCYQSLEAESNSADNTDSESCCSETE